MVMLNRVWLAGRSLFWTIALPGVVAGYLPWRFFGLRSLVIDLSALWHWVALLLTGLGVALLAACVFEFARSGAGTLAPVDPPRVLVVRGLYRYVRNPMYLSVTLIILGEALVAGSRALLIYWAIWFLAANLLVIAYEEPTLRRRFGRSYDLYTKQVRRWLPRIRPATI